MLYARGHKGKRSAKHVRLALDVIFENVVLNVFEGEGAERRTTHSFYPDRVFLEGMRNYANEAIARMDLVEKKLKESQHRNSEVEASHAESSSAGDHL
jgi:hypothetical protein